MIWIISFPSHYIFDESMSILTTSTYSKQMTTVLTKKSTPPESDTEKKNDEDENEYESVLHIM